MMYKGEYSTATLFFNKASDSNSRYVPVWNNTGVNYARQGQYQKALVAFKKLKKRINFLSHLFTTKLFYTYVLD